MSVSGRILHSYEMDVALSTEGGRQRIPGGSLQQLPAALWLISSWWGFQPRKSEVTSMLCCSDLRGDWRAPLCAVSGFVAMLYVKVRTERTSA